MKRQARILPVIIFVVLIILTLSGSLLFMQFTNNKVNNKGSDQLLNTTWKAVQFNGRDIQENVLLTIEKDSIGFSICNNIGYGKIKITEDEIHFHSEANLTLMACDEPLMSLETEFINVFNKPINYVIEDDSLILTDERNKITFTKYLSQSGDVNTRDRLDALTFEKNSVLFKYSNNKNDVLTEAFTLMTEISQIDAIENEIPKLELIQNLYDGQSASKSLYHLGGDRDTYYQLMPGFYRKIFLTSEVQDLNTTEANNYNISETKCSILDSNMSISTTKDNNFEQKYKIQDCATFVENKDTGIVMNSRIQHCYIPLKESLYLAYEQVGNIVDGSYDLCSEIQNSGLVNVSVVDTNPVLPD